jgi:hypothetical protein
VNRILLLTSLAGLLLTSLETPVQAQPSRELAQKVLALPPRPKRPDLPPSALPLQFIKGEEGQIRGSGGRFVKERSAVTQYLNLWLQESQTPKPFPEPR